MSYFVVCGAQCFWNASPTGLLHQLTKVGLAVEAPSAALMNRAQMYRTAVASSVFAVLEREFEQAKLDDDATYLPRFG